MRARASMTNAGTGFTRCPADAEPADDEGPGPLLTPHSSILHFGEWTSASGTAPHPVDQREPVYTSGMNETTDPLLTATRAAAAVRRQQGRVADLKANAGKDPEAYAEAVAMLRTLVERHAEAVRTAISGRK